MRVRLFCLPLVMVALFLACSTKGNAQSYFTYGFYQILDNTGTPLSSTTVAGFNVPRCQSVQGAYGLVTSCSPPNPFTYLKLPLEVNGISGGTGSCADEPPPPFASL
jgi:hypothetical protein